MSAQQPSGGFSLFPNTTTGPPRRTTPRPNRESRDEAPSPSQAQVPHAISTEGQYAAEASLPRQGRETPQHQHRVASPAESHRQQEYGQDGRQSAMGGRMDGPSTAPVVQQPRQAEDVPGRSETAFSQAQTLVRNGSTRSRSSIAKRPFPDEAGPSEEPAHLRSIFPQYNPELPVNRQDYFPTQASPTHIPMSTISRNLYSPEPGTPRSPPQALSSHPVASPRSNAREAQQQWPPNRPQPQEPPVTPPTSTLEDVRSLWKVASGWKASASEGQVYCLKMAQEKDAPIYNLSSATQPFYNLRIDPTSVSAYITLSRHDPSKPYRAPPTLGGAMSSGSSILSGRMGHSSSTKADKHWQEVISTSLEEESRRHRPEDGLVALLYPSVAAKMAIERPEDEAAVYAAERECARLVWDDDSDSHYLVHPALATPFCVTIDRTPSWSRVEYTLEHHESPHHLAKLTRDGTGGGHLEVDTGLASKIESYYIIDVAVCALMIVAASDERANNIETFEPPPPPRAHLSGSPRSDRFSLTSLGVRGKEAKKQKRRRMEEMEVQDVESQDYSFGKPEVARIKSSMPWPARAVWWVVKGVGKAAIWCITMFLKACLAVLMGIGRCFGLTSTYGKK